MSKAATCHPDRLHRARGLCGSCYQMRWRRETGFVAGKDKNRARYQRSGRCLTLQRKYGITSDTYDRLYAQQEGKCRICTRQSSPLHVDHDHNTKEVRGLLCGSCNRGLGMFQDNPKVLAAAIDYLGVRLDV